MPLDLDADVVVVGAGIIGLTSALSLIRRQPGRRVLVLDKETSAAAHQTGHNSGVIHSGIYYRPRSAKSKLVAAGRVRLLSFLEENGIAHELCGKVIVAVDARELPRLDELEERAVANRVPTRRLTPADLHQREPHIRGVGALEVPSAGIVDFGAVCDGVIAELGAAGAELQLGTRVLEVDETTNLVRLTTNRGPIRAGSLVNCGGLHSDRLARRSGATGDNHRIMPFRGEYYELRPEARHLVRDLVYPVPDPAFPFLGVHLTRMVDGTIHAGPNAVPALHREGYRRRDFSLRDSAELAFSMRTWRLARRYWRTGLGEVRRSISRKAFLRALRRLCPDLTEPDLVPAPAGVRAQAITTSGALLDDFAFAGGRRSIHVVNAPSPAATASFAIAEQVAARHEEMLAELS